MHDLKIIEIMLNVIYINLLIFWVHLIIIIIIIF